MAPPVEIVGSGARTPLGLLSASSAAAYRAGISAMREHPFMIDRAGDPMPAALDAVLDPAVVGPNRLLAMAETALREACAPLRSNGRSRLHLPLFLALPELRPGFTVRDVDEVRDRIARIENLPIEISDVRTLTEGHAAGLSALSIANERIQEGAFDACLVGGVDSYFQPDTMEWLDENRQLATAEARSAFVPGEGAGFCLLMNGRTRTRHGLDCMGRVVAVAVGRETCLIKTSDLCLGAGLTEVVQRAVAGLAPDTDTISDVICDVNGERYRGEEWGFVCLRLSEYFDDPADYRSPADCWGDVGAASGPLFAMLACQAAARGHARGPRTLLWTSSESGLRAAAILETADRS